jgi:hypothetical protein
VIYILSTHTHTSTGWESKKIPTHKKKNGPGTSRARALSRPRRRPRGRSTRPTKTKTKPKQDLFTLRARSPPLHISTPMHTRARRLFFCTEYLFRERDRVKKTNQHKKTTTTTGRATGRALAHRSQNKHAGVWNTSALKQKQAARSARAPSLPPRPRPLRLVSLMAPNPRTLTTRATTRKHQRGQSTSNGQGTGHRPLPPSRPPARVSPPCCRLPPANDDPPAALLLLIRQFTHMRGYAVSLFFFSSLKSRHLTQTRA